MPEQECASKQPRAGEITHACTASRACPLYKYASVCLVTLVPASGPLGILLTGHSGTLAGVIRFADMAT